MPLKAVTKFLLTDKTHESLKKGMCCDAAHQTNWSGRHTCTAQKGILVFEDASFAIVHATNPIAIPFLTLQPIEASREILQNHLATTNTRVGGDTQVESQQTGEGGKESGEEKEKEKETGVAEDLASTSKMLLSKLRGEEGIAGRSFPLTRPLATLSRAVYGARSSDSEPETIPVSGGMADTLCKDVGIPGLESELGDGEGWVVLKKGDGFGDEAEGEGDDGEEEGLCLFAGWEEG
ncbi:hypothetical protein KC324_g2523 [Hortaea werneckii]|nr:hypothetical protein KC324_g2523 [Hortaea werneckii]